MYTRTSPNQNPKIRGVSELKTSGKICFGGTDTYIDSFLDFIDLPKKITPTGHNFYMNTSLIRNSGIQSDIYTKTAPEGLCKIF